MTALLVTFSDGSEKEVTLGAFAQIAAKRRYGLEAIKSDDPEVVFFGIFVELVGPAAAKDSEAFDSWTLGVQGFRLAQPAADPDPTTAEESPGSSPDSPPTSD